MTRFDRLPTLAARCGLAVLLLSLVAACTWGRSQDAKEARTKLVGMSRSEIIACAGNPKTTIRDGSREYLAYVAGSPDYDLVLGVKPNEVQKLTGTARPVNCKVRFMLRDDVVESVSYTGNTGGLLTRDSACAAVVRRCLPPGSGD
jgi:hypothetical protein